MSQTVQENINKVVQKLTSTITKKSGNKPVVKKNNTENKQIEVKNNDNTNITIDLNNNPIWFYIDNYRKQKGPVSTNNIKKLFEKSQIQRLTLCWKTGMSSWEKIEEVEDLKFLCKEKTFDEMNDEEVMKKFEKETGIESEMDNILAIRKRKRKKNKMKWKNNAKQMSIYITGLPKDINKEDMFEFFSKCGIIKKDLITGDYKIKIYKDKNGEVNGDGVVTYFKEESVQLAIEMLDDTEIRPNHKIKVEKASFKMKGNKFIKKDINSESMINQNQNKELDWNDDKFVYEKGLRIVILKPMFDPDEAEMINGKIFYDELAEEVGLECQKKCGMIDKLTVFEGSPEGVIAIKFKTPAGANKCIELMNDRFFGGKKISCSYFDGTDYRVTKNESEASKIKRYAEFGNWLNKS